MAPDLPQSLPFRRGVDLLNMWFEDGANPTAEILCDCGTVTLLTVEGLVQGAAADRSPIRATARSSARTVTAASVGTRTTQTVTGSRATRVRQSRRAGGSADVLLRSLRRGQRLVAVLRAVIWPHARVCGTKALCNDVPSSLLPPSTAPAKPAMPLPNALEETTDG